MKGPHYSSRDHFVYAPSQWDMTLQCNVISHWVDAFTKWSLLMSIKVYTYTTGASVIIEPHQYHSISSYAHEESGKFGQCISQRWLASQQQVPGGNNVTSRAKLVTTSFGPYIMNEEVSWMVNNKDPKLNLWLMIRPLAKKAQWNAAYVTL